MPHPAQQLEILVAAAAPLSQHLHTTLLLVARRVTHVAEPQALLRSLWDSAPDLLLILCAPPEHPAVPALCGQVRSFYQIPILVLEQGATEEERISWLDAGADDVLSVRVGVSPELPARCRALVQRARRQQRRDPTSHRLHALGMQLDVMGRRLFLPQGQPVALTDNLTRFLAVCFVHGGAVVPTETLGRHIYGRQPADLRQRLTALAQALQERTAGVSGPRPSLEAVRGLGYRLAVSAGGAAGAPAEEAGARPQGPP